MVDLVQEAMMVEPTKTESLETLDLYVQTIKEILDKANNDPNYLKDAPYHTPVRRLDEASASRHPVLNYERLNQPLRLGSGEH